MGKGNKGTQARPAQAPATPVVVPKANAGVLAVKQGLVYRGARAAWYGVLLQHNGNTAGAYLAACAANPPSLPKSGRAEAPTGWLRYFVRTGACTVTTP